MDKFKELLKAQGVSEETIAKVVEEMGKQKIYTAGEENLDIRYKKLKEQHDTLTKQHNEATKLIEDMKAKGSNTEELQKKIGEYETTVRDLNTKLAQTNLDNAIKVALLEAKANDVDYLTFKLKEKSELSLDENGKLKDGNKLIEELKITHPTQFESAKTKEKIEPKKLKENNTKGAEITQEQFDKMGYIERLNLYDTNRELYNKLTGKTSETDKE